jgi:hypothetical protein
LNEGAISPLKEQPVRCLPSLSLLVALVLALGSTVATAYRPPPGDRTDCTHNADIEACTRLIESGTLKGAALATIYWHRASKWEDKEEYARAVADYTEAIRRLTAWPACTASRARTQTPSRSTSAR